MSALGCQCRRIGPANSASKSGCLPWTSSCRASSSFRPAATRAVVEVPDFAIAERPVTQAEFRLWLDAEGTAAGFRCWGGPEAYAPGERDRLPALGVPFPAAQAYAQWRGRITGRDIRLPTHDQWEKAARGVDGRIYPWGDSWEATFANGPEGEPAGSTPRPVGSVPEDRSVYGVCDLAGGVSEWVLGEVPHRPKHSWLRGGSWNSHPNFARLCSRRTEPKTNDGGTLGFRLVQCL